MTSDKNFKRRVRERAEKTGESYTTARMQLTKGRGKPTTGHIGINPETNAIQRALEHAGVRVSEAMVLGAGGGLGAGYIAITHGMTGFMIGSRALWWDSPGFVRAACERLGAAVTMKETSSRPAALKNLREALESGALPIVWLDMTCMPYSTLPPQFRKGGYHVAAVAGLDESADRVSMVETAREPLGVTPAELAEARASITSFKNRLAVVAAPREPLDLERAALEGAVACAEGLLKGRARTFVLDGFRAWGEAVGATKGKEAWSALFKSNEDLFRALTSVYRFVEQWGGAGLLRPLFAEFLDETAALTGRAAFRGAAEAYRECARLWHEVADAALPEDVPLLRDAREALIGARRARDERGDAGMEEVRANVTRLAELGAEAARDFPMSAPDVAALFQDLSRRIIAAYDAEMLAVAELKGAPAA